LRKLNPQNLKPIQSMDEARELGRKGGIASGKSRRERAKMSAILLTYLEKTHNVKHSGKIKRVSTEVLLCDALDKAITKGGSNLVGLIKVIGELTEGQRYIHETGININENDEAIKEILKKYGVSRD